MVDTLVQVEDEKAKRNAQRLLERGVRASLKSQGVRNIGFPSGNRDETLHSLGDGRLWCAFGDAEDAKIPRRWNAFGVFEKRRYAQIITVEINIPTTTNSAAVAGFFARDPVTSAVYLMHDGSVGGGKRGVGQGAFLAWSTRDLIPVERTEAGPRFGILIGRVDALDLADRIWKYVQEVRAFKDAVDGGELDTPAFKKRLVEWEKYRRESSGRRRGSRKAEIDYISYHGDVVHELWRQRVARKTPDELVTRSPLIDLLVRDGQSITEVYEIKTSLDRQSLYTAVGQLMTHSVGAAPDASRTLVLPEGPIPDDLAQCIGGLGIAVRRFRLRGRSTSKVVLVE